MASTSTAEDVQAPSAPSFNKRSVPPPSGFIDLVHGLTLAMSRKYLLLDVRRRVFTYAGVVLALSVIGMVPLPRDYYFAQKHNILNQYFVKFGWGWTLSLTGTFVCLTALVYCSNDWMKVVKHLCRLMIATLIWYTTTAIFLSIEHHTGVCTQQIQNGGFRKCRNAGGEWLPGFDISGHCFLLIYCSLIIREEVRVMRSWDAMKRLLDDAPKEPYQLSLLSKEQIKISSELHVEYTGWIKSVFMFMAGLVFIWEIMLCATCIFFHSITQKILGAGFAIGFWYLTYGYWYKTDRFPSPGSPGESDIKYTKYKRSFS